MEELHDLAAFYEREAAILMERWHSQHQHTAG
jgi:hypothetical protein